MSELSHIRGPGVVKVTYPGRAIAQLEDKGEGLNEPPRERSF